MASNGEELSLRLHALCADVDNAPSAASVHSFIAQGADINTKGNTGRSILEYAAQHGHLDAAKELLAAEGINIGVKGSYTGYTAFVLACLNGRLEIAKLLLAAHMKLNPNFDINEVYEHGFTVLMRTCNNSRVEVVKFLLSIPHINVQAKNDEGKTAFAYVKGQVNEDEMRALFQSELIASLFCELQSTCSLSYLTHTTNTLRFHSILLSGPYSAAFLHFSQLSITERCDSWY
jgi:ankyrin repeat protein